MYERRKPGKSTLVRNTRYEGETIEQKINRIVNNNEPISDGAPLIYTDRKAGVQPEYDPRTDRFEVAIDAMDKVSKSKLAAREERHEPKESKESKESKQAKADADKAAESGKTVPEGTPKA